MKKSQSHCVRSYIDDSNCIFVHVKGEWNMMNVWNLKVFYKLKHDVGMIKKGIR